MKTALLPLLLLSILESGAEQEEVPAWSALASQAKPEGSDFEKQFRRRHFYLVSRGLCSRVPKESILYLPKEYQALVVEKPKGRQVNWIEFLAANRSWLRHQDVTWPQVLGEAPLSPTILHALANEDRLVIATYRGGPVTVLPASPDKTDERKPHLEKK